MFSDVAEPSGQNEKNEINDFESSKMMQLTNFLQTLNLDKNLSQEQKNKLFLEACLKATSCADAIIWLIEPDGMKIKPCSKTIKERVEMQLGQGLAGTLDRKSVV